METFADKAINYYLSLNIEAGLPDGIRIVNPYKNEEVKRIVKIFYNKYFNDSNERIFIFGINPGRFGAGLTGICFTDPAALREYCGIENDMGSRKELSSKFIYNFIEQYGGVRKFYSKYFLTALFPLALLQNGKNFNYYDKPEIFNSLKSDLYRSFKEQVSFGARRRAFCLGNKNYKFLKEINNSFNFFGDIKVLYHPRYIMQYRQKNIEKYVEEYLRNFE